MASGYWRIASGLLLVPVAVASVAGCSGGTSTATASMAKSSASANTGFSAAKLRGALLTQVNGVAAAAPASSGNYSSLTNTGKQGANAVQVTPKTCAGAVTGFNPTTLAGSPAAAVTFQVGTNGISEVLIASSAKSASTVLAGRIPAECAKYQAKVGGKTYTYGTTEQAVTGIGQQASVLNVEPAGAKSENLWSVIYRGKGFVGTVTVVGPNSSQKAVTELGQQAYAYALKSLS
jgi:hypothetical protein